MRYIEKHSLGFPEPIYMISILENYSRAILASKISRTQNQWDYLEVLFAALSTAGAPKGIVSDGGGIFYSNMALELYDMLDIRKERIDPGEPWQNYAETLFSVQKRLADHDFSNARTWPEMLQAHQKWWTNYNRESHYAHRERQDGRHSPQQVLRGMLARTLPAPTLARIFFATEFTRYLDRSGYIRFRRWRFYAEEGLARQQVQVSIYTSTLKIEYQDTELALYTTGWAEDNTHITEVKNPRLIETGYQSPQLKLWTLGPDEWLLFLKLPDYATRKKSKGAPDVIQLPLLSQDWNQRQEVSS